MLPADPADFFRPFLQPEMTIPQRHEGERKMREALSVAFPNGSPVGDLVSYMSRWTVGSSGSCEKFDRPLAPFQFICTRAWRASWLPLLTSAVVVGIKVGTDGVTIVELNATYETS